MSNKVDDTKVLKVDPRSVHFPPGSDIPEISDKETKSALEKAVKILQTTHEPVAFPTETVYGLGASGLDSDSAKAIYKAKNRPADNPLILHISSLNQLHRLLYPDPLPSAYTRLVEKFWPGPLTIILPLPKSSRISPICTAGQSTFAVRMPAHPVARALIALSDIPLAAPSANASTRPSPTTADHVYQDLKGRIPLILDGGPCLVGLESTVVDATTASGPAILRPGGVSLEQIRNYGGTEWENVIVGKSNAEQGESVKTPGMKYRHYSPKAPVTVIQGINNSAEGKKFIFNYLSKLQEEGKNNNNNNKSIGILSTKYIPPLNSDEFKKININYISLGTSGIDISRNMFAGLRSLDDLNVDSILVEGVDDSDEGLAIMNRLRKAACGNVISL